jgi:hypothetical protein
MNALVIEHEPLAPVAEGATLLSVIARAARDPNTDVGKMERLMVMYQTIEAKRAEAEFAEALSNLQLELPSIGERGGIKDRGGNVQSTYALWEDINETIKPILHKHGFALSFRTDCSDGIAVTGVLSHKNGYRESTTIKLPADTTGSKNAVQAVASSVSYGKRYTAGALLNLTSHGEDDDGKAAATKPKREPTGKPQDGMRIEDMPEKRQIVIREHAQSILALADSGKIDAAAHEWRDSKLSHEEKAAAWFELPSHHRTAINRVLKR